MYLITTQKMSRLSTKILFEVFCFWKTKIIRNFWAIAILYMHKQTGSGKPLTTSIISSKLEFRCGNMERLEKNLSHDFTSKAEDYEGLSGFMKRGEKFVKKSDALISMIIIRVFRWRVHWKILPRCCGSSILVVEFVFLLVLLYR